MIFASLEHVLQSIPLAVVNGRGGRNQHDRFYQELLNEARRLQTHYRTMQKNAEKRRVQLQLIGWVEVQGGAFVKRNANGTFRCMNQTEKLKKVSQMLRQRPSTRNNSIPPPSLVIIDTVRDDAATVASDGIDNTAAVDSITVHAPPTLTVVVSRDLPTDDESMANSLSSEVSSWIEDMDESTVLTFPLEMSDNDDASLSSWDPSLLEILLALQNE